MTGKSHGRNGEKRSYRVPLGQRCPLSGNVLNRAINATALEKEMLNVLREVLLSKPDLKETLRRAAADHVHKDEPLNDHDQVEKTLKKRQKQIAVGMQNLTGEVELDRPIEAKLAEYREDVMRLRTARRLTPTPKMPINIDAAADQLAAELADFGSILDGKDFTIIHEMFGLLVHKMEADLGEDMAAITNDSLQDPKKICFGIRDEILVDLNLRERHSGRSGVAANAEKSKDESKASSGLIGHSESYTGIRWIGRELN